MNFGNEVVFGLLIGLCSVGYSCAYDIGIHASTEQCDAICTKMPQILRQNVERHKLCDLPGRRFESIHIFQDLSTSIRCIKRITYLSTALPIDANASEQKRLKNYQNCRNGSMYVELFVRLGHRTDQCSINHRIRNMFARLYVFFFSDTNYLFVVKRQVTICT